MFVRLLSFIVESWLLFVYVAFAEKRNKKEYSHGLIRILSFAEDKNKIVSAIYKIREYDKPLHDDLLRVIKRVVLVESRGSDVLLAKGTILISETDQSHLATETHLAGWLLYYYVLLRSVRKTGLLRWTSDRHLEAKEEGERLRKDFLAGTPPRNRKKKGSRINR